MNVQPAEHPSPGYLLGSEAFALAWERAPVITIAEWANESRWVFEGPEQGWWQGDRIPYLNGIMNALMPDHPAPLVIFMKSAQVGGSALALNWLGWMICNAPANLLALFPTTVDARDWVRRQLNKLVSTTPKLGKLISLRRSADGGNSLSQKVYPGGTLFTGSAGIATNVAGKSMPYLLLDEVDRFPKTIAGEGDPVELAKARAYTFPRKKVFEISSPVAEGASHIADDYEKSTQDRYHVPCPHCGHMQHLRWEQMTWPEHEPEKAAYRCEADECGALIEEHHKTDMLARGEWRAKYPERESTCKGFHINALYTPIGLGSRWAEHAAKWDEVQGRPEELQPFYNTRLGQVYRGETKRLEWEVVKKRAEGYRLRTIPKGVLVLTSGTDVQIDRLETQILGTGRGEQTTTIDYIVHYGDTTRPEVWAKLDNYLAMPIENSFGVPMQLRCSLVDAGFLPDTVLGFTRERKGRGIFASRGSTQANRQPIGKPSYPDVKRRGKTDIRGGVERYEIGVSILKHWLYERLRADENRPEDREGARRRRGVPTPTAGDPAKPPPRHCVFSTELDDEYFRQLVAEKHDPIKGWIAGEHRRNEALDTYILARAASMHHNVMVHRMRELDWQRLEELYESAAGARAKPPAEELGKQAISLPGGFLPTPANTK